MVETESAMELNPSRMLSPVRRRLSVSEQLRGLSPLKRSASLRTSNAIEQFSLIEDLLDERHLILLLDYDGTLTPIVSDPTKALLSEDVRETLRRLPKHFVTGIVSGRSLAKIKDFVNVPGLYYAGSHGFDLETPDPQSTCGHCIDGDGGDADAGEANAAAAADGIISSDGTISSVNHGSVAAGGISGIRHQVASEFLPVLQSIRSECEAALASIPGATVEDNRFSVSLHYRNCARVDVPRVAAVAKEAQDRHPGIRLSNGKEVFELQPNFEWNKGSAVVWLLEMLGVGRPQPLPLENVIFGSGGSGGGGGDGGSGGGGSGGSPGNGGGGGGNDVGGGGRNGVFTIFIGDDRTDEDAFRVFCPPNMAGNGGRLGRDRTVLPRHEGMGILVSEDWRETSAGFTLRSPHEVAEFLALLADLGRRKKLRPFWCRPQKSLGRTASAAEMAAINAGRERRAEEGEEAAATTAAAEAVPAGSSSCGDPLADVVKIGSVGSSAGESGSSSTLDLSSSSRHGACGSPTR